MWGILRPFHGQSKCLSTEVLWCMIEVSNLINFYSNRRELTWCCRNCPFRNSQLLKIRSLEVWIQKSTFILLKFIIFFFVQEITDVLEMRVNMVASTSGVDIDVDVPPDTRRIFTSTSVLVSLIIFRHKKMAINLVCFYEEQWNRSTVISCYIFFSFPSLLSLLLFFALKRGRNSYNTKESTIPFTLCDTAGSYVQWRYLFLKIFFVADINECRSRLTCGQAQCRNTLGAYYCTCHHGYVLNPDGRSCQGKANVRP